MQACLIWDQQAWERPGVVTRHTIITVPNVNGPVVLSPGDADGECRADAEAKKRQRNDEPLHAAGSFKRFTQLEPLRSSVSTNLFTG